MALLISILAGRPASWRGGAWAAGALGLLLGLGLPGPASLAAEAPEAGEYRVKAVFVFNFTHFTQWPPATLPAIPAPLVIGIIGTDPFGPYLDQAVRGEAFAGRPLVVRHYRDPAEVAGCQILFISDSESPRLRQILERVRGRGILTVGEAEGFAERGGMIAFVTEAHKIRLKINVEAARAAALTIDARLLRSARLVVTERIDP